MMKIGYSSLLCPEWDLDTIVKNASTMGFDGVELHGLQGEFDLPRVPALAQDPDRARHLFDEHGVELACLGTSAKLDSCSAAEIERQKAVITDFLELAAKLGCPCVRIDAGMVQSFDNRHAALSRIAEMLASMVSAASRFGVTLLVENGSDFPRSEDLWFLVDAVGHPAVRCCWNQCNALAAGELATRSIPRLGTKIGLVHQCDARFDEHGVLLEYTPLGEGDVQIARQVELLTGLMYDGYVVFERPKTGTGSLPEPEAVLRPAGQFLRERVDKKQAILSAYKGDKYAPRMASRVTCPDTDP